MRQNVLAGLLTADPESLKLGAEKDFLAMALEGGSEELILAGVGRGTLEGEVQEDLACTGGEEFVQ